MYVGWLNGSRAEKMEGYCGPEPRESLLIGPGDCGRIDRHPFWKGYEDSSLPANLRAWLRVIRLWVVTCTDKDINLHISQILCVLI